MYEIGISTIEDFSMIRCIDHLDKSGFALVDLSTILLPLATFPFALNSLEISTPVTRIGIHSAIF